MRVGIYGRVSTSDKGQDVQNQLVQLREYCGRRGWTIAREYVDHVSGKSSSNRAEFQRLFADASKGKLDVVLFWALDRFSREGVYETLCHLQKLDALGVAWKSYTEEYLDSCGMFKDAVIAILAAVAKQERIRVSERVLAGLALARAKGRVLGRPARAVDVPALLSLRGSGKTWREIAEETGIPLRSVLRAVAVKRIAKNPAA